MRWGGVLAAVLGVVVIAQVTRGNALSRLGLIDPSMEGFTSTLVSPAASAVTQ